MKINKLVVALLSVFALVSSCNKKNDNLVMPLKDFPQVVKFDDEGDGGVEDEDKFSFTVTLNDKVDPSGKELGGDIIPLIQHAQVHFEIKDLEGFDQLGDYIKSWKAFYEIDDCTESDDLPMTFDPETGKGVVQFPAGVKEIEVEFETDDAFFDDDIVNEEERSLTVIFTSVEAGSDNLVINASGEFKYEILDDDAAYGDWVIDHENAALFEKFKALFAPVNEEIAALDAVDVDKIEISIKYDEVAVVVELKETEMIEECGETEETHKKIEIEADLEEISALAADGDIELAGEVEQEDGTIKEYVYKGAFTVTGNKLSLTLQGEYDDNEIQEITLLLEK